MRKMKYFRIDVLMLCFILGISGCAGKKAQLKTQPGGASTQQVSNSKEEIPVPATSHSAPAAQAGAQPPEPSQPPKMVEAQVLTSPPAPSAEPPVPATPQPPSPAAVETSISAASKISRSPTLDAASCPLDGTITGSSSGKSTCTTIATSKTRGSPSGDTPCKPLAASTRSIYSTTSSSSGSPASSAITAIRCSNDKARDACNRSWSDLQFRQCGHL